MVVAFYQVAVTKKKESFHPLGVSTSQVESFLITQNQFHNIYHHSLNDFPTFVSTVSIGKKKPWEFPLCKQSLQIRL